MARTEPARMGEGWTLIGVGIVLLGLALRLRTTLVVVAAALATGAVAGLPFLPQNGQEGLLAMLGRGFADNRLMSLFIITLPAIGLCERYGLQKRSGELIHKLPAATPGKLLMVYQWFRISHGALGLRMNGHPSFVRPLIYPMALGAAEEPSEEQVERLKAASAAAENYGNFYGQNLSWVQAGVLLVFGVMKGLGVPVDLHRLVLFTVPVVGLSIVVAAWQFRRLDRGLVRKP